MTDITENDKHELLTQIAALREEFKELHAYMDEHKKLGTAIYQKTQSTAKIIEDNASGIEDSTRKVVAAALEGIQSELKRTINEGMMDGREHFEVVAEKVGDKHNQEMNGLWRFLPLGGALLCLLATLAGGMIMYFLTPKIDSDTAAQLQAGSFCESLWPKLSKSDQDRFTAIAQGEELDKSDKKGKKA